MKRPIQLITNEIHSDMVRKEEFQGEMHYMIKSATMPDDIVMNGILYPAEEIEMSFEGMNGIHSPVGHPVNDEGMFISATDPFAIRNYYIGAQVVNVERKNGKIYHDTAINIAAAKQSDRGKRVLDRVEALMNGDNTKPIHTSTGVFMKKNDLDTPMSNQYGEYSAIASGLVFDHNAILLDEVGAATPDQGTGMAVNSENQEVFVHNMDAPEEAPSNEKSVTFTYAEDDKEGFLNKLSSFIKSIGFASTNHEAYNDDGKQTKTEVYEMTPEEFKAALADQSTALQANFETSLASAVKPLQDKIESLEANAQSAEKAEKEALIAKSGLDAEIAAEMSVNALKAVVAKLDSLDAGEFGERVGTELAANGQAKKEFSDELPEG